MRQLLKYLIGSWILINASLASADWKTIEIDPIFALNPVASITHDNMLQVSYNNGQQFKTALKNGSDWQLAILPTSPNDLPDLYRGIYQQAVDSQGIWHIAYQVGEQLKYATNATGDWQTTSLFTINPEDNYQRLTLALDINDNVHILYSQEDNIRYTTNQTGQWQTDTVYQATLDKALQTWIYEAHLAVDAMGNAHVSFVTERRWVGKNAENPYYLAINIMYGVRNSGQWQISKIGWEKKRGQRTISFPIMAVSSQGVAHIVYATKELNNSKEYSIRYKTNLSGQWRTRKILRTQTDVYPSHIAVDKDNHVHIAYRYGTGMNHMKYTTNATGKWQHEDIYQEAVTQGISAGNGAAYDEQSILIIDRDGVPHYLYNDWRDEVFRHAVPN